MSDIPYYVGHDTSPAGQLCADANDGRDPFGFDQSCDTFAQSADEIYGSILRVQGNFTAYADTLLARGATTIEQVVALGDHAFISDFTGAVDATAGNLRIAACTAEDMDLIVQANAAYSAVTAYSVGERVTLDGIIYINIMAGTGASPQGENGAKHWRQIDTVCPGAAQIDDLTDLTDVVFGTGPKLTIDAAIALTLPGDTVNVCGFATTHLYEIAATASCIKSSNYGTAALRIGASIGCDWYGKHQPGVRLRDGQRTWIRPTSDFTPDDSLMESGSGSDNFAYWRGIKLDGADAEGTRLAGYLFEGNNTNNDIHDVSYCGFTNNKGAIAIRFNDNKTVTFDRNVVDGCYGTALYISTGANMAVTGNIIANTQLRSGDGSGIFSQSIAFAAIVGNEIHHNAKNGILIDYAGQPMRHLITENTIAYNGTNGIDLSSNTVSVSHGTAPYRNSFVGNGTSGTGYGVKFPAGVAATKIDDNHFDGNATGKTNLTTTPGINNTSGDPLFVDAAAGDFRVKRLSPLLTLEPQAKLGAGLPLPSRKRRVGAGGSGNILRSASMEPIRATHFTNDEADVTALTDTRVSAAAQPAGVGSIGIAGMGSARLGIVCNTTAATGRFDVHVLHGEAPAATTGRQYVGQLTKIGELDFTAGGTQFAADDLVAPSMYACAITFTPEEAFGDFENARDETGTAVIGKVLHLMCLCGASRLILKPAAFSGVNVTANVLAEVAVG